MKRALLTAAAIAVLCMVPAGSASAGDGWGGVDCDHSPASCHVTAGSHGTAGYPAAPEQPKNGGAPPQTCRNPGGQTIPCQDPSLGSVGGDGCYYRPTKRPAGRKQPKGKGGWYERVCTNSGSGWNTQFGGPQWIPGDPPKKTKLSPQELAAIAVEHLHIPAPRVVMNPRAVTLVGVPVWWWVSGWGSVSKTASAGGVSVTATASPVRVVWSSTDGAQITCTGPGTPWRAGTDPRAASPDCGHTYTRSSASQPGEKFTVTATMVWQVRWHGAGQAGTFNDLSTSDSDRVRVLESQAINTS